MPCSACIRLWVISYSRMRECRLSLRSITNRRNASKVSALVASENVAGTEGVAEWRGRSERARRQIIARLGLRPTAFIWRFELKVWRLTFDLNSKR